MDTADTAPGECEDMLRDNGLQFPTVNTVVNIETLVAQGYGLAEAAEIVEGQRRFSGGSGVPAEMLAVWERIKHLI